MLVLSEAAPPPALSVGSAALLVAEDKPESVGGAAGTEKGLYLPPERSAAAAGLAEDALMKLPLELPRPTFIGTPKAPPKDTTVDLKTLGLKRGAFIVPKGATPTVAELSDWVKATLRSTKTPEAWEFRAELPYNETGKLLRRVLKQELSRAAAPAKA